MADNDRGGTCRVRSGVSEEELLAAVRIHAPATTREVADEVGMPQEETDRRLQGLREEGHVDSTTIATSLAWVDPADHTHEQSTAWRDLFDEDFTLNNADRRDSSTPRFVTGTVTPPKRATPPPRGGGGQSPSQRPVYTHPPRRPP